MAENTEGPSEGFDPEELDELLKALEAAAASSADVDPFAPLSADADEARLLHTLDREVEGWTRRQATHEQWTWERFGDLEDPCAGEFCEAPALGLCCEGARAIRRELAILEARMRVRPSQPLAAEIMRLRALLTVEDDA